MTRITRRRIIATSAASVGITALPLSSWLTDATAAPPVRTRYNVTSTDGMKMLDKYAKAVHEMRTAIPKGDPRHWEFQWYSHWIPGPQDPWSAVAQKKAQTIDSVYAGKPPSDPHRLLATAMWDNCEAHGDNPNDPNFYQEQLFLPWHRYFVYYFEDIIRGVLKDDTFTLPYWNYLSGNVADLSIPKPFQDTNSPLYQSNRNPWVNAGQRIDKENPGSLNLNAFKETSYIVPPPNGGVGFDPVLDNNPHGLVHDYVGGSNNMGQVPTAANDPIFWLHHCNLDRLWESWNRLPGRKNPAWPNRSFPFADRNGNGVKVPVAGADRVALLNYNYDQYYKPLVIPTIPSANLLAFSIPTTRLAATAEVALAAERTRVQLELPAGLEFAPNANLKALDVLPANRQYYLVIGGVMIHGPLTATYNVFLDAKEDATSLTPGDPHYVGTLNFFGVALAAEHGGGTQHVHGHSFNVTDVVKALQAKGELSPKPTVTLQRQGDVGDAKPIIGQVYIVEI